MSSRKLTFKDVVQQSQQGIYQCFKDFAREYLCLESLLFYEAALEFASLSSGEFAIVSCPFLITALVEDRKQKLNDIIQQFLKPGCEYEIFCPSSIAEHICSVKDDPPQDALLELQVLTYWSTLYTQGPFLSR